MSLSLYYIICGVLAILVILGIWMMSQVKTSVQGNLLSAFGLFSGVLVTLIHYEILSVVSIYIFMLVGLSIGFYMYRRVKMIQMPQMVALLNGVGGAASAIVGALSLIGVGNALTEYPVFSNITASLALVIGVITLVGSLIAAGKLHRILPQKPVVFNNHGALTKLSLLGSLVAVALAFFIGKDVAVISNPYFILIIGILFSAAFGYIFAIRVGGADMPITISLLNSLSGVAGAVAGMAIGHILLVAVGGVVGASGLLLTQIMCRAMNRNLLDILTGKTSAPKQKGSKADVKTEVKAAPAKAHKPKEKQTAATVLADAKSVIIVPGYGMALAQAQHLVKQLADQLEQNGADVKYAIHPVAGRMPGHMNVLLAEADVSYEQLYEMDAVNDEFKNVDAVVVIGANDVLNPSARDAKDTPIYGMPILNVDEAKNVIVCNYDLNPGYAGVDNPIYTKTEGVFLQLGDAKKTVQQLLMDMNSAKTEAESTVSSTKKDLGASNALANAKSVIIVPGYGMALAQAQHLVKQLADQLELNGAEVKYAIHPVAGRMPGHMNVLLAEADVPYEQLYEMDAVNEEFKNVDAVVVIGANDVLNPSARDAKDTPIYGMPILNVDEAKEVIICNFDLNPGYAGVDNPLYTRKEGVSLRLGDAKETVKQLLTELQDDQPSFDTKFDTDLDKQAPIAGAMLAAAHSVIIVPGYGMALAQAQHLVKQLADQLELNGAEVKYAIHPVAGRMPGHMNVLLAEADVPYEKLYEMDAVNDEFENTDAVVVIGANDVLNPAARDAVDTPIYGMPILNVDKAKNIIICNFDLNPGYAGVDNPLYTRKEGVSLRLGDAKETVKQLLTELQDDQPCFDTEFETDLEKQAPIAGAMLAAAHSVIIVPGYGMALAQAQHLVKQLADQLELNGAKVKYAIHPVAGRMPGHMNVLLAEADVPYDQLYEMDVVNEEFENTDAVVVIGANDVLNPAARDAVDTPIYGMPILNVDKAKNIIICNFDLNPGYAGVDNPIYKRDEGVVLKLGDAKETLQNLLTELQTAQTAIDTSVADSAKSLSPMASGVLAAAHSVIIVPGYGMALAQAQHLVKQLADQLETNGAEVKFAIHPVAGRMPGHMNVLLAEADVPYDQLYEMDAVNEEFKNVDAVVVIGANDVLNPAARDAVDTPIYGMPILNVDEAKEVIICNFDLNPGYAGVNNPLYEREEGVHIKLGDAKETLQELLKELQNIQRNESV